MYRPFVIEIVPRFSDTDAYGVVHHSNYYKWIEEARFAFTREVLQFEMQDFEERGLRIFVLESSCKHKVPVRYGDRLRVELLITISKVAKWVFHYRVVNAVTGQLHAEAMTSHAYVTLDGKMLLNHPQWLMERVDRALEEDPGKYVKELQR